MEVVSFTPRPIYPPGKKASSTHAMGETVGSRVGPDAVQKSLFPLPEIEPQFLSRPTNIPVLY
jgi:hypothetical protein